MENPLDISGLGEFGTEVVTTPFTEVFYKGKSEYAGPFYTINVAHVDHLPEYEVIGVNGEVLQVRRGEDVPNIPKAFIEVLKNAITSHQVKRVNPDRTEYYEWVPRPAIPYQIVEGPYKNRKEV